MQLRRLPFAIYCATQVTTWSVAEGSAVAAPSSSSSSAAKPPKFLKKPHARKSRSERSEDDCDFYPEIVLVQDVTQSYADDMENLKRLMPQLFDLFERRFDGHVRFGITSFVDKYHPKTGWAMSNDYCAKVNMPLTDVSNEEAMQKAMETFANLRIYGGNDYHDGGNEGLVRAALSDAVGWRNITHDPRTGRPIVRLLVLATDAAFHDAGYAQELFKLDPPLPPFKLDEELVKDDINAGCLEMDFPTGSDIAEVLTRRNIMPIIFSGNARQAGNPNRIWAQYKKEWVSRFKKQGRWDDLDEGLRNYFEDYFRDVVKRKAVVQLIDSTSSNFIQVFEDAMAEVTNLTCMPPSTEAPAIGEGGGSIPGSAAGTRPPTTTTAPSENSTSEEKDGGNTAVIIGSATGGAGVVAIAAGLAAAKKMGFLFNGEPAADTTIDDATATDNTPQDREQFEAVTGDLFA